MSIQYSNPVDDYYILADFEIKYNNDGIGVSYANWSNYNYIEDEINQDNPPIFCHLSLLNRGKPCKMMLAI
jgi:hypothetical protein